MFWIENIEDSAFVLFSKCSFEPYKQELVGFGGMYVEKVKSNQEDDVREGWCFSANKRESVEKFIHQAKANVEEVDDEDELSMDNLYDLIAEAFERIADLENKNSLRSSKNMAEFARRIEVLEKQVGALRRLKNL